MHLFFNLYLTDAERNVWYEYKEYGFVTINSSKKLCNEELKDPYFLHDFKAKRISIFTWKL